MRGMILAAGLGTRMQPLTKDLPKPLMPVAGRPLIDYAANLLVAAGVKKAVVNLHYLGDQVKRHLDQRADLGLEFSYSPETEILGTGGGINQARQFLVDPDRPSQPFIVTNADSILFGADLSQALKQHQGRQALATMIVTKRSDARRYGAVVFQPDNRVVDIAGLVGSKAAQPDHEAVFTGVYLLSPEIFSLMPNQEVFCMVRQVLAPAIQKGETVLAFPTGAPWIDAGQPAEYLQANRQVLGYLSDRQPAAEGFLISASAEVESDVRLIAPVLIASGAKVRAGASIGPNVVIGKEALIGSSASLREVVVWDRAVVQAQADLSGCVVTASGVLTVG